MIEIIASQILRVLLELLHIVGLSIYVFYYDLLY